MPKTFVISLGGSLIVPDNVNSAFLKKFGDFIISQTKKGNKFIIVTGGGAPARKYQAALKNSGQPSADDLDWMGIYATRLNAQLLKLALKEHAHPDILTNFDKKLVFKEKILLAGGHKPGRSSDGAMVKIAQTYGAKTVINLSNIDYLYTKDPRKFKTAKKIEQTSWKDFFKIIGAKWSPGANVPFDPTAAKIAEKNGIKVVIANGKNLKNLQNILENKKFKGTVIK